MPIVLHGVGKINICTDMFISMMNRIKAVTNSGTINYTEVMTATEAALTEVVKSKLVLFGSQNRA
ncbi:hypothetical protein GCM10010912_45070 [Paenibacillus albidus]|uniref:Uncharacterized protein n=1 Tax=Paenibacillus albidus TaxID=2041023 RepID=A0A917CPR7_9BACL|nr:hypothetical protein GCM10010912_45070 [Paenibacillus albidus]